MDKAELVQIAKDNIDEDHGGMAWDKYTQEQLVKILVRDLG